MVPYHDNVKLYTLDEFFAFATQSEHISRHYELIGGEIYLVESRTYASVVAARCCAFIVKHVHIDNDLGAVTGADGGYLVNGEAYIPDAAYISYARQREPVEDHGYNVLASDLAVEVLSPGNTPQEISTKVTNYLIAGMVVWLADPAKETVTVYIPAEKPVTLTTDDTLTGGDLLPGFSVLVHDLFPEPPIA